MEFKITNEYCKRVWDDVSQRYADQGHFLQAVGLVLETISPVVAKMPELEKFAVLERLVEPERVVMFRVPWTDDKGKPHVNRGFRVQFNSAIGPYKGGLRFSPEVGLDVLKFLGFEQILKNSLTTLPMGGGKGGSDFDPHGKSDAEVMRFCQSFMTELQRHIGPDTDVPAGDKGVGGREVAWMFGQYKRIRNEYTGVLTGKGLEFGGSLVRPEATGYGLIYFADCMLRQIGDTLEGKTAIISGDGNVAQYATEKLLQLGAKVLTLSDSSGYIYDEEGIDYKKLEYVKKFRAKKEKIDAYVKKYPKAKFYKGQKPWGVKADLAFPCATQDEIYLEDAKKLVENKVRLVAEGANMPTRAEAIEYLQKKGVMFAPGKAANAGGVAVSGLEMSQNSERLSWSFEEVDAKLKDIMTNIHKNAWDTAKKYATEGDYVAGSNIAGFVKVARAMIAQGLV
ncbi:MAG: NADP-specific glutamate dehydrogenase [Treponema sp.]|nr:NADP-specific glutamate dehydrogenase [Treponema sp.]